MKAKAPKKDGEGDIAPPLTHLLSCKNTENAPIYPKMLLVLQRRTKVCQNAILHPLRNAINRVFTIHIM